MGTNIRAAKCYQLWILLTALVSTVYCFYPVCKICNKFRPQKEVHTMYSWKTLNYLYPSKRVEEQMSSKKQYIEENVVPYDISYWYDGSETDKELLFITTPKIMKGVPATLSTVCHDTKLLKPFPDWSWHIGPESETCKRIFSVMTTQIDRCNRIWIVDSGVANWFSSPEYNCPPKLLVMDLKKNNSLIMSYTFPDGDILCDSLLAQIAVDVRGDCCDDDVVAYISDTTRSGLIVYDHKDKSSHRVYSNYFWPVPEDGIIPFSSGKDITRMMGIYGLALSPKCDTLYFTPRSSKQQCFISTSDIQNKTAFPNNNRISPELSKCYYHKKPGTTLGIARDSNGVIYFTNIGRNTLGCWNSNYPFNGYYVDEICEDNERMRFIVAMEVDKYRKEKEESLFCLSGNYHSYIFGTYDKTVPNFYVLRASTAELVGGTTCDKRVPPAYTCPLHGIFHYYLQ